MSMSRGFITKAEIKTYILRLKHKIESDQLTWEQKDSVNKYLNSILSKIDEYRY